ncbi:tyrosine-type recombinase/integrase [Brevibacillus parabrevis]|uniref:tyrosine-type recombinase/integrase n=1 Tax=Brevibacillus parabrevis TaxID=54914 RepID=UPI001C213AC7|nr:tyrosine-type recombinase/integrase [Brevibacillus parabrevis]MBU8715453.1 tyrosine-type recombinase/integrase [Brevibacillus parabrevis]
MAQKRTRRPNTIKSFVSGGESHYAEEALDFDTARETFLRNCRVKNLSDQSLRYYREGLKSLFDGLRDLGVDKPLDVTADHVNEIVLTRKDDGLSDAYVNSLLRGWRVFFRFLHDDGYLPTNPTEKTRLIKAERRIVQTFSREQVKALLAVPDRSTFTGYRNYVLMLTLLETGIRIAEAEALKVTDIRWRDRIMVVYGKGRKERMVPFQKTLEKHLKEYVTIRGALDHDYVFVNIDNGPQKKRAMQDEIRKIGLEAGLRGVRVSPHTFRHTFAKIYIMNGGDVFSLQKILGHTTLQMVQTYVSLFGTDIAAQHRKFSPLESLEGRQ